MFGTWTYEGAENKKQTVKCFTVLIYFANFFNAILASLDEFKKNHSQSLLKIKIMLMLNMQKSQGG